MSESGSDHYFNFDGIRHHYVAWGDEKNPTILMLHGIRGFARTWTPTADALADDYRVIALDHRGRGDSGWSPNGDYFTDAYVADIGALVSELGIGRFGLVGHSMGGANAFVYANRNRDRVIAMVIEDIGPGSSATGAGKERIIREFGQTPSSFASWADAIAYWARARPGMSAQSLQSRLQGMLKEEDDRIVWRYDLDGVRTARLQMADDPSKLPDLWKCVDQLTFPTLVIKGGNSDFLSDETLAARALRSPHVVTHVTPGASHYVHDDNFPDFAEALKDFLGRTVLAGPTASSGRT